MKLQTTMLADLLQRFEGSKHLRQPHVSKRGVFLRKEQGELRGYDWEQVDSLELFRKEAVFLEEQAVATVDWESSGKVIAKISLNLDNVSCSYELLGLTPPWMLCQQRMTALDTAFSSVESSWLLQWKEQLQEKVNTTWKLPTYCQKGEDYWEQLLNTLLVYDKLPQKTITQRSFSILCFQNSKTFEQVYQEDFLRIMKDAQSELRKILETSSLKPKEILSFLGISPREELWEVSGGMIFHTAEHPLDLRGAYGCSVGISSGFCEKITSISFCSLKKILLIENKTNYEAYLHRISSEEAVFYHGGFSSPGKLAFYEKIQQSLVDTEIEVGFWGDIDLGGMLMFQQLRKVFPDCRPHLMDFQSFSLYTDYGLPREKAYLQKVAQALAQEKFSDFPESRIILQGILDQKLTIEQEVFLLEG